MTHSLRSFALATVPLAAVAALSGLGATAAYADTDTDAMAAQETHVDSAELAALKAEARELREAAAKVPGKRDTQPPQLYSISTSGSVNVQFPNQSVTTDLDIRDNLSGVALYYIEYQSPSGKMHVARLKRVATPLTHVTPTLTIGSTYSEPAFTVWDEPGTWKADYFYAFDAAGNENQYFTNQIGFTGFNVTNNGGYDNTPPVLASGTVETPVIRRSKGPKGAVPGTPPYVSVDVSITDSGNGATSGNFDGVMVFCHLVSQNNCDDTLTLTGNTNQAGQIANTMTVGVQMRANQTLGQYVMQSFVLRDLALNPTTYTSTVFGGNTNFANYFPQGTTIFINQ